MFAIFGQYTAVSRRMSFCWLIGTALLFLCLQRARSATFNIADGDVAGLSNAIVVANYANADTTINLATNGSYTLFAPLASIRLANTENGHALTINGGGAVIDGSSNYPIFAAYNGQGDSNYFVVVNSLILRNGNAGSQGGGAIHLESGGVSLTLNNCTISSNRADRGGGIYVGSATATLNNCTVNDNTAGSVDGGDAFFNLEGSLTLRNCTLRGNGNIGIYNKNSILVLSSCTLQFSPIFNDRGSTVGVTWATLFSAIPPTPPCTTSEAEPLRPSAITLAVTTGAAF